MNHDLLRRFAYIETCLYWGTGVTAPHLGQVFGIARQNAQKTISDYRQQHPDNMIYDRSQKCHIATDRFKPCYITTDTEHYLDYIAGISAIEHYWQVDEWTEIPFESDAKYLKPPQQRPLVKAILSSIKEEYCIDVMYRAKRRTQAMTLSAHRLVYANYRYHIRAYHHQWNKFIDVVLGRLLEVDKSAEDWVSTTGDQDWHNELTLTFTINPDLPVEVQQALQADYHLGNDKVRVIQVRKALLGYICREMERIDWQYGMRLWLDTDNCCYQRYHQ